MRDTVSTFANLAFRLSVGQAVPKIGSPGCISRGVYSVAIISIALPFVLIPEVIFPYPYAELVFFATLTAQAFVRLLLVRLYPALANRRIPRPSRWIAILFLSSASFVDINLLWMTRTGEDVGLAIGLGVAFLAFLLTLDMQGA